MPRKLDKKLIQGRVKENKTLMRTNKVALLLEMSAAAQGKEVHRKKAQQDLTGYMKAALAVTADNAKLEILKQAALDDLEQSQVESNNGNS